MSLEALISFFGWLVLLNLGGILFMFVALWKFSDTIGTINNRLFGIAPEQVQLTFFRLFYLWRVLFFVFILAPWLALLIIR